MLHREITKEEIIRLAAREESHFFDRKSRQCSGRGIQKLAVAFANADGGEMLIGVKDEKEEPDPLKRWDGSESLEALNHLLQAIFDINPSLDVKYEVLSGGEPRGHALRVMVEKSSYVHKTSDGKVYQRYGAQSIPLNDPQKITELTFAKGASSFEDQKLEDVEPEQVVDSEHLQEFLKTITPSMDGLDFCVGQNLLDHKTWTPRVCGVLLFHSCPSAIMPRKCAVKITRYETKEDDPEREHLANQVTIEGPLYQLIHDSVSGIKSLMESVRIWSSEGLVNAQYPPEAIWEILVNAVIHRDYSISDDVQVLIYDNRIEVLSPGRLPGYVNVDNILDARFSRNPKIVRTLNRYPDAPNKDLGEGLNTAFQRMTDFGLKEPLIVEVGNYVKVTLPHTPLAAPSEAIIDFLYKSGRITNRQAREITGIKSENLVKVEFYKLRDEGIIERVPGLKGPKAAWQLKET